MTELTPTNDRLRERAEAMEAKPELLYRRLNFPEGVPPEYEWTGPDENTQRYGGGGIQRMAYDTWLDVSRKEEKAEGGHIGETGKGSLPRPKEHGECECALCVENGRRMGLRAG